MSELEDLLEFQLNAACLPAPLRERCFAVGRRFRADFMWPDQALIVEVDGGTWIGGRHQTGAGYTRDCVKLNLATLAHWRVLRFTGDMVRSGEALKMIEQALGLSPTPEYSVRRTENAQAAGMNMYSSDATLRRSVRR